jgi:hypothetical protein
MNQGFAFESEFAITKSAIETAHATRYTSGDARQPH